MMKGKLEYNKIFGNRKNKKTNVVYTALCPRKFLKKKFSFNEKILDFGGGIRSPNYKKTAEDGGNYFGFDIDKDAISWLDDNNFYVDFWKTEEKFDIILASEVYEHLDSETRENFIERSFQLLKSNGLLIVDFPYIYNLDGSFYWLDRTHLFPPSPIDDSLLMELYGFKTEIYVVGIAYWPPYRILRIMLNLLLGYCPHHTTILVCNKRQA